MLERQHIYDMVVSQKNNLCIKEVFAITNNPSLFKKYLKHYKQDLYVKILNTLTHETFSKKQARILYHEILSHRNILSDLLGRDVGIVVSALDYLQNIKSLIPLPTILRKSKSASMIELSTMDALTHLYSREVLMIFSKNILSDFCRSQTASSLLFLDIDDFKNINDTYGHIQGDQVLTAIGACINRLTRVSDIAARYGGEEIVVLLPNTHLEHALRIAEKLRKAIEKLSFNSFSVTVSIGVTQIKENDTIKTWIKRADKALYRAKKSGKNKLLSQ